MLGLSINFQTEPEVDVPEKKKDKGCSDEEILAILGHELGHWKLSHVLKNLGISQVRINLLIYGAVNSAIIFENSSFKCSSLFSFWLFIVVPIKTFISSNLPRTCWTICLLWLYDY